MTADEIRAIGYDVYGLSTQAPAEQAEARERLGLTFHLLSDEDLAFVTEMRLPTFTVGGKRLVKRLTLVIAAGAVARVF